MLTPGWLERRRLPLPCGLSSELDSEDLHWIDCTSDSWAYIKRCTMCHPFSSMELKVSNRAFTRAQRGKLSYCDAP